MIGTKKCEWLLQKLSVVLATARFVKISVNVYLFIKVE